VSAAAIESLVLAELPAVAVRRDDVGWRQGENAAGYAVRDERMPHGARIRPTGIEAPWPKRIVAASGTVTP
jgi:hypothetical protein